MNVLTTTWRQLVRRRLWPAALLLVAALAAVPVLLSRDAESVAVPAPSAPVSTAKVSDSLSADPIVEPATPEERSRRRRVLGVRKDPFTPESVKHPKKPKKAKATRTAPRQTPSKQPSGPSSSPGSSPSPSTSAPGTPVAVTPAPATPKPKQYAKGSLIVRFGDATADTLEKFNLPKLAALPKASTQDVDPLLVYTGLTKTRKKAIFLVDESLNPTGDGTCKPHPASCETIELAKGETEFFDVVDPDTGDITAQYELDLVDIK